MESNPKNKGILGIFSKNKNKSNSNIDNNQSTAEQNTNNLVEEEKSKETKQSKFKFSPISVTKTTPVCVFSFDIYDKTINILQMVGTDFTTAKITSVSYRTNPLTKEFFERFPSLIEPYIEKGDKKVACYIIFPNQSVCLNIISVPNVGKKQIDDSSNTLLNNLYKNNKNLITRKYVVSSNKQVSSYCVISFKKEEISNLYLSLSKARLNLNATSYVANSILSAVLQLKNKNKGHSFIFIDVRKNATLFIFVFKGAVIGYYRLSFGLKILDTNKIVVENMVSSHDLAEATVITARENAKSKSGIKSSVDDNLGIDSQTGKKVPKKLPKALQRAIPETAEEVKYENFRMIIKWANLLKSDYDAKNLDLNFEYFLINLPLEYNYVVDKANAEKLEGQLDFIAFNQELELSQELIANLDLYGAIYLTSVNKNHVL